MPRPILLAAALFLTGAAPAHAAFTVTPSTTQAGAPANVTIHADFGTTPSHVALHLPPGLVGNPSAASKCPIATFKAGGCSPASQVGTASATPSLGIPIPGVVYNLEPQPGEPARLGITIGLLVQNQASVTLRPDGGLDSTIAALEDGGLGVKALDLTLSSSFMTLPTSCAPATTTIDADTTASASFTPTGCASVPFSPSVSASLETTQRVVPSGATVALTLPTGQSHVRRAEIVLPLGTTLSPGVASGLEACTDAQFGGAGCPAGSQVGTVSFVTPLLGTLAGKVYFGDGFRLYIVVEGSGVLVKLPGDVKLDPATGQITTIFDNLPQVPFTSFALTFQGGAHAVLANPVVVWHQGPERGADAVERDGAEDRERELHDRRRRPRWRLHRRGVRSRAAGRVGLDGRRPSRGCGDALGQPGRRVAGPRAGHDAAAARTRQVR